MRKVSQIGWFITSSDGNTLCENQSSRGNLQLQPQRCEKWTNSRSMFSRLTDHLHPREAFFLTVVNTGTVWWVLMSWCVNPDKFKRVDFVFTWLYVELTQLLLVCLSLFIYADFHKRLFQPRIRPHFSSSLFLATGSYGGRKVSQFNRNWAIVKHESKRKLVLQWLIIWDRFVVTCWAEKPIRRRGLVEQKWLWL